MTERLSSTTRIIVTVCFLIGLAIVVLDPFTWGRVSGVMQLVAGAIAVILAAALGAMVLGRGEMPEEEFRRISRRSELLATLPPGQAQPSEFEEAVVEAIDDLPIEVQDVLKDVPIVISDLGHEFHAYGHYIGDTVARDDFRDHIVIYQDTLERDFGWDPDLLRSQIARTVRHEVAHHLGWNERGVRDLGL
ncbi:MAG TPA: metallopeptidase family protein [Solirubrobacterales bacterium]|jgi:predicted Zn-dependent protease with MMP-like domain|nr:metallopeptidase family protein [Solirubrobacterales bacterium]